MQPSLVIVYFGGNDSMGPHSSGLGPHVPLPEYIENLKQIAVHLKVHFSAKLICLIDLVTYESAFYKNRCAY